MSSLLRVPAPLGLLICGAIAVFATGNAGATTCITYQPEIFELTFREITRDGTATEDPVGLGEIREMDSTVSQDGEGVLLKVEGDDKSLAKFYALDSTITPTDAVQAHIDEIDGKSTRGGALCPGVPLEVVRPGIYVFSRDWGGGDGSAIIEDPVVTVPADRQQVLLDFDYSGSAWTAVYDVDATHFDGEEPGCGCSTAPSDRGWTMVLVFLGLLGLRRCP
ncbi:MYXO-CTERM sorting domain-containing protein [Paraliomyxa miuraensis]|uniref:MYXO-CTERM sorting domain-containing protein n=1 Tax=Paraliomyxa miuraensis TaxID=376150 RepID=UPI00225589D9|nr:MYXO-CTERM sorting domain-containing protein [Paraliomyxa miuraensis]MCX4243071.1 MYXO-CTERM sorting domain-containing protein [Paraliomyxa miuraensis]